MTDYQQFYSSPTLKLYDIRTTQPIYGNLQRCYQKFICKGKQNFRKPSLGNTFIVHDDHGSFI